MYVILVLLGVMIFFVSFLIQFKNSMEEEMKLPFECGFDYFSMVRISFSLHFFKICLIFIFFDIEIVVILPLPMIMGVSEKFFLFLVLSLMVIFLGLIFEWSQGSINWFF